MKNLLVLTPLSLELKALEKSFESFGCDKRIETVGHLRVTHFPELGLRISQGGHGKTQFAIQAQSLIQHYAQNKSEKIQALICAGCAGSLVPNLTPLDVIIGTKSVEHDFKLRFVQKPLPEFPGSAELINKLMAFKSKKFRVHFGPIASGDEDIIDGNRAEELRSFTGSAAVAWEGAGGARVAKFNGLPYLEVRGITDLADHKAIKDAAEHLEQTMVHAAEVLKFLALPN